MPLHPSTVPVQHVIFLLLFTSFHLSHDANFVSDFAEASHICFDGVRGHRACHERAVSPHAEIGHCLGDAYSTVPEESVFVAHFHCQNIDGAWQQVFLQVHNLLFQRRQFRRIREYDDAEIIRTNCSLVILQSIQRLSIRVRLVVGVQSIDRESILTCFPRHGSFWFWLVRRGWQNIPSSSLFLLKFSTVSLLEFFITISRKLLKRLTSTPLLPPRRRLLLLLLLLLFFLLSIIVVTRNYHHHILILLLFLLLRDFSSSHRRRRQEEAANITTITNHHTYFTNPLPSFSSIPYADYTHSKLLFSLSLSLSVVLSPAISLINPGRWSPS